MLTVRNIFISPGHNYFGHYGQPAGSHPIVEVERIECVANMGLKGDRFYGYRPEYRGQVTFFSHEVWLELLAEFRLKRSAVPSILRRNVVVSGIDLNELIGAKFMLQDIEFQAMEECRPCHWMNQAIAPGAEHWLKGRGGLRCRVLTGGVLVRDLATASVA